MLRQLSLLPFFALLPSGAIAEDFFSDIAIETEEPSKGDSRFNSKGYIQQKLKYGIGEPDLNFPFDRQEAGLAQAQTDLFYELSFAFSSNVKAQLSAKAELDWLQWQEGEQEWQLNHERVFLKDAYLDANFDNGHWLRIGHQVFAWGESEGLAISDILAPNDMREFGQAELRDVREHVPALMWSFPALGGTLNWVGTWDAGTNRYASEDEEFYPYIAFRNTGLNIETLDPEEQWELALKYDYKFNGGDLSIVAADTNNNEATIHSLNFETPLIELRQERVRMLAISINRAKNSWLFKGELGRYWDQAVFEGATLAPRYDQWRGMGGAEFSGWNHWRLSYEFNFIYQDEDSEIDAGNRDASQLGHVASIRHDALKERLNQQLWLIKLLEDNGSVIRYDLSYDMNDSLEIASALVLYDNTDRESQLYAFRHHDTFNVSLKLSF
jgi:hypothetical protein